MKHHPEKRICPLLLRNQKLRNQNNQPLLHGYAAVFNQLSENLGGFREIIAPTAFNGVLNDDVRALINHDPNLILGRTCAQTLRIFVDNKGLSYEITPPDTQYAQDLIQNIQRGDVSQSSFAFRVEDDSWMEDDEGRIIRTIEKVRHLYDVSPVTYAAYPDTQVAARALNQWQQAGKAHPQNFKGLNARLAARTWLYQHT